MDNTKCPICGSKKISCRYQERGRTCTDANGFIDIKQNLSDEVKTYGPYQCLSCGHEWDDGITP